MGVDEIQSRISDFMSMDDEWIMSARMTDEEHAVALSALSLIRDNGIAAEESDLTAYFKEDGGFYVEVHGQVAIGLGTLRDMCNVLGREESQCFVVNIDAENEEHTRLFFAANKNSTPVD